MPLVDPNSLSDVTLVSRYELGMLIGRGGMGLVYQALDTRLKREVAVKLVNRASADDVTAERMAREARTAGALRHPNTVRVYDTGVTEDGRPFLVMELVKGVAIHQIAKPVLPARAAWIGAEVCAALEEAHGLGIVHRDLKPQNLMLESDSGAERVRVLDFGIARFLREGETITQQGGFVGTARYTSPEQAEALEVGPQSDLYSLGVVLFELLTGQPPFQASTDASLLYLHVHRRPAAITKLAPSVPPGLSAIVERCLRKDPSDRPTSAAELRSLLVPFAEDHSAVEVGSISGEGNAHLVSAQFPVSNQDRIGRAHVFGLIPNSQRTQTNTIRPRSGWFSASVSAVAALAVAATAFAPTQTQPAATMNKQVEPRIEQGAQVVIPGTVHAVIPDAHPSLLERLQDRVRSSGAAHMLAVSTSGHVIEHARQHSSDAPPRALPAQRPPSRTPAVDEEVEALTAVAESNARVELHGELLSLRQRTAGDNAHQALRRELQLLANGTE